MSRSVRVGLLAFLGLAVMIAAPVGLRAQDFGLELVDAGKPVANAEVLLLVNLAQVPLGTTDSSGRLTAATNRDDIARGTRVDVYQIECDGEIVVVIVPPQDVALLEEECERRRHENPNCTCRRIGGFLWGDDVTIDVGRNSVIQAVTEEGAEPIGNLTLGFSFDLRQMYNLEDVTREAVGASDASTSGWAPGFHLSAEYRFRDVLTLGLEGAYSTMETETTLPQGIQTGDLDYYEFGGSLKFGPRTVRPVRPYVVLALYRTWNHADFTLGGLTDHRVHKTRRDGLGLGLDYRVTPRVGLRFEGLYNTTFEDGDADEHVRWRLGFLYTPIFDY